MHTFENLPPVLSAAAAKLLADTNTKDVTAHARSLHQRYMTPDRGTKTPLIRSDKDMLAYMSLRFPATFAQIAGALYQIKERIPDWEPKTVLDLGCGPGTGVFAAHTVWPGISSATAIDQEEYFLSLGKYLQYGTKSDVDITWKKQHITSWVAESGQLSYDLIIVANVINELSTELTHNLLSKLADLKGGIVLLLEPGTSHGFKMIQSAAEKLTKYRPLIAPYIGHTLIQSHDYWVHFSQRFVRPEFQRMMRQSLRDSDLMASDWEETKYAYVAAGEVPVTKHPYAVCIGPVELYHGYLQVPVLTGQSVEKVKVMKRHKEQYRFAKNLAWGETIWSRDDIHAVTPRPEDDHGKIRNSVV